jgi:DNA modification methylase
MNKEAVGLTWTPVQVRLRDLDGWEKNPKRLSEQQADRILRSLKKLGQLQTIAVSPPKPNGRRDIYDGHQRNSVWQKAYSPDLVVWALEASRFLTEQERKEVAVLTMQARASFDWDMLAQWDDVEDFFDDFDVRGWRDDAEALAALLAEVGGEQRGVVDAEPQIDRAEELRKKWRVEPGQLWQLGEHRLICGDCTDAAVVERLMAGEKADMVIADPPYGLSIVAANGYVGGGESAAGMIPFGGKKVRRKGYVGGGEGYRLRHGHYAIEEYQKNKRFGTIGGAKPFGSSNARGSNRAARVVDVGKYMPIVGDETTDTAIRAVTFYLNAYPQAAQFWFGANYYSEVLKASPCWVVWDKETTGNFADCELAWSNVNRAAKIFRHRWNGMLRDSERGRRWHPTQKPAALAAFLMTEFGKMGDIVIDPFAGAGWTVIGGENTGRRVRAIELVPEYIAVICERWAQATGKTPELVNE